MHAYKRRRFKTKNNNDTNADRASAQPTSAYDTHALDLRTGFNAHTTNTHLAKKEIRILVRPSEVRLANAVRGEAERVAKRDLALARDGGVLRHAPRLARRARLGHTQEHAVLVARFRRTRCTQHFHVEFDRERVASCARLLFLDG